MLRMLKEYRKQQVLWQIILEDEGLQNQTIPKAYELEAATRTQNSNLKKQNQSRPSAGNPKH